MKRFYFIALILLVGLVGCATVENTQLDKNNRQKIKSVALLKVGEPQFFQVRDLSAAARLGIFGGAIGGALQGNTDDQNSQKFVKLINGKNIKLGEHIALAVRSELEKAGLNVQYLSDQVPKLAADKKSDDYSEIVTNKDAILNIWFGPVGFVNSEKFSTEYQPWLVVNARLIDAKTKLTIYRKTFNVGHEGKFNNAEFITLDSKYIFGDSRDLFKRFDFAVDSLLNGEELVAEKIGSDIN
jgi:hypothetical protein